MGLEDRIAPMHSRHPARSSLSRTENEAEAIFAPRIWLVDADPLARAQLEAYLRERGFDIVVAPDLKPTRHSVDAVIVALDGMAPRADRPDWLLQKPDIPTIVLDRTYVFSGRATPLGFTPDARLSLPVPPRKLAATIRRVLSLARIESADPAEATARLYRFAGWTLDCKSCRLESAGKSIPLATQEFRVLKALLTFPRRVLTRRQLIVLVWGHDMRVENRTLDRPITRLRRHLGDDVKFPALLKTVVGVGYRLDVEVEKLV